MALKQTGYTEDTPKYYLVDAGAVYKNIVYDDGSGEFNGDLLGATSGGNRVTLNQEYRQVKIDGVFTTPVGSDILTKAEAKIEINVKEVTAEAIRAAINGTIRNAETDEAPSGYKIIEGKSKVETADYINNLGLVGTLTGSDQPVIFVMSHAFCTSGLEFDTKDDDEAVIKMMFESRANAGEVQDRKMPVKIYYPNIA